MTHENRVFVASVPELSELHYFLGTIKSDVIGEVCESSDYNRQMNATRLLISENKRILAAPVRSRFSEIHIIVSKKHFQSGFLVNRNITLNGPRPLDDFLYEKCVNFTVICRLNSDWNNLDKYLVKSKGFLCKSEPFDGIGLETYVRDGLLTLSARAYRLKLPPITARDLGINTNHLHSKGSVFMQKRVYALPRLITGTLIGLSKELPSSCPFRNYSDLVIYWKETYGYQLPPYSENTLYAEVLINRNPKPYCYPLCCIRLKKTEYIKSDCPEKILNEFITSFVEEFNSICDENIEVQSLNDELHFPSMEIAREISDDVKTTCSSEYIIHEGDKDLDEKKTNQECEACSAVTYEPSKKKPPKRKDGSGSPKLFSPDIQVQLVPHEHVTGKDDRMYTPIFTPTAKVVLVERSEM